MSLRTSRRLHLPKAGWRSPAVENVQVLVIYHLSSGVVFGAIDTRMLSKQQGYNDAARRWPWHIRTGLLVLTALDNLLGKAKIFLIGQNRSADKVHTQLGCACNCEVAKAHVPWNKF